MGHLPGSPPDGWTTAGSALRVVVIDDDPDVHALVVATLASRGHLEVVGTATNAADGLDVVAAQRPDVVLLDLSLGPHDGATLVGPIVRSSPRTMVAAFSALPRASHEERLKGLGAFAYYPKASLPALPELIERDHQLFARALAGEVVVAPAALPQPVG